MKARLLFTVVNVLLALFCVLVTERAFGVEAELHTNKLIYGVVSAMVAWAFGRRICLSFFKQENFSNFGKFLLVGVITVILSCIGIFINLTFVQPMGIVVGILMAAVVFVGQTHSVGILYIFLITVLSCLMFSFNKKVS